MRRFLYSLLFLFLIISCSKDNGGGGGGGQVPVPVTDDVSQYQARTWDKSKRGGVFYEIFVRSFADGNGDGVGDLKGITAKLDYLNELGVSGIWITPIHKTGSYHGYDVEDYKSVAADLGTQADFDAMIAKAHSLGIKVILDFVVNHTSKFHPWFTSAISSETSSYRNYFLFAPANEVQQWISNGMVPMTNYYSAGQWHNVPSGTTGFKYMGMFSDWMPDINFGPVSTCENSDPFKAIVDAAKFWLGKGVDGFRLDAVKHIYQNEDSDENPIFLQKFYNELKKTKADIYMVGENLTGDYQKVAPYYKGLPAMFNFDAWYKLIYAINNEHAKWYPKDIIDMENRFVQVRTDFINATKLSNHDEDRTISVLGTDKMKARIAAAIMLTVSGSPYLYYGEELGMLGMKGNDDKNVREPFLWSNFSTDIYRAKWFTPANSTDNTVKPLNQQMTDYESLYRIYKKFIELRNTYPALASGTMSLPSNFDSYPKNFMVFYREAAGEKLLIVHNVSSNYTRYEINQKVKKAIADMGRVNYTQEPNDNLSILMPPYSTIIFEI